MTGFNQAPQVYASGIATMVTANRSSVVDLKGNTVTGIQLPNNWVASQITFEISDNASPFLLYYDGTSSPVAPVAVNTPAGPCFVDFGASRFLGVRIFRVVSSVEQPVGAVLNILGRKF